MHALVNARLYTGSQILSGHCLLLKEQKILGHCQHADLPKDAEITDCSGLSLAPGLIDLQVNGGGNILLNDQPTPEAIGKVITAHRLHGTTGMLATFISDTQQKRREFIKAAQAVYAQKFPGFLGVHLEGPHLNPLKQGVHKADFMDAPDVEDMALIRAPRKGITMVTLAPETLPADMLADLAKAGIIVAAGHSHATYGQVTEAFKHGLAGFTHLFNAMEPMRARQPGIVGAALDDETSWVSLIADGQHVHPALLRLAIRAKPAGKVFLVSDAMPPSALAVGQMAEDFFLYGDRIKVKEGVCLNSEGKLAGSAATLWDCVRTLHSQCAVALDETLRMASLYPAAALGIDNQYGKLEGGFFADIIGFDALMNVKKVWISGSSL